MQIDEVARDVPLEGLDEGWPAALQAFEKVGTAEAHQAFAGARKAIELFCFCRGWPLSGRFRDVVGEAVARQVQPIDDLHYVIGLERGVGAAERRLCHQELDGTRD